MLNGMSTGTHKQLKTFLEHLDSVKACDWAESTSVIRPAVLVETAKNLTFPYILTKWLEWSSLGGLEWKDAHRATPFPPRLYCQFSASVGNGRMAQQAKIAGARRSAVWFRGARHFAIRGGVKPVWPGLQAPRQGLQLRKVLP